MLYLVVVVVVGKQLNTTSKLVFSLQATQIYYLLYSLALILSHLIISFVFEFLLTVDNSSCVCVCCHHLHDYYRFAFTNFPSSKAI
mgnify:CR=1 FL=1